MLTELRKSTFPPANMQPSWHVTVQIPIGTQYFNLEIGENGKLLHLFLMFFFKG